MDFEDYTLYAQYRTGHTGSLASPWRLPPSLAWLPWLLLPRAGSWTTSLCSSPTTPRRRRGVTPHRQQLLLLLPPCFFVDLVALLLFAHTLAPPYNERSPIWATLTTTTPRRWLLHLDSFALHGYYTNGLSARRASPWLLSLVLPYAQRWLTTRTSTRSCSSPTPPLPPYGECASAWATLTLLPTASLYNALDDLTLRGNRTPPPYSGRASPWPLSLTTNRTSGRATCLPS